MTKSERRYRNRLYAGLEDAVDAVPMKKSVCGETTADVITASSPQRSLKIGSRTPATMEDNLNPRRIKYEQEINPAAHRLFYHPI